MKISEAIKIVRKAGYRLQEDSNDNAELILAHVDAKLKDARFPKYLPAYGKMTKDGLTTYTKIGNNEGHKAVIVCCRATFKVPYKPSETRAWFLARFYDDGDVYVPGYQTKEEWTEQSQDLVQRLIDIFQLTYDGENMFHSDDPGLKLREVEEDED